VRHELAIETGWGEPGKAVPCPYKKEAAGRAAGLAADPAGRMEKTGVMSYDGAALFTVSVSLLLVFLCPRYPLADARGGGWGLGPMTPTTKARRHERTNVAGLKPGAAR
jgi:hypothetical protein